MTARIDQDSALVVRLQGGDDEAFTQIMERYKRPIFSFIHRMTGDPDEAEDLALEVFVKAYRNIHRFKLDQHTLFSTWLFQIARNHSFDFLRRRQKRRTDRVAPNELDQLPGNLMWPADSLEQQEVGERIARAVDELPPKQRAVLILSIYNGLSHAEIGQIMKCSVRSVESRLGRARDKLQETLRFLLIQK